MELSFTFESDTLNEDYVTKLCVVCDVKVVKNQLKVNVVNIFNENKEIELHDLGEQDLDKLSKHIESIEDETIAQLEKYNKDVMEDLAFSTYKDSYND